MSQAVLDADACGALGCRESATLVRVSTDRGTRVLCPPHADDYTATEGDA